MLSLFLRGVYFFVDVVVQVLRIRLLTGKILIPLFNLPTPFVCRLFHRLVAEHASRECEKLRSDLQEANQRSSLLAQEVDENHAKQESIRLTQFK